MVKSRHQFCRPGICQDLANVHSDRAERRQQGQAQGGEQTTTLWWTAGQGRVGVPGMGDDDGRGPDKRETDAPHRAAERGVRSRPPSLLMVADPRQDRQGRRGAWGEMTRQCPSRREADNSDAPAGDTIPPSLRDQGSRRWSFAVIVFIVAVLVNVIFVIKVVT